MKSAELLKIKLTEGGLEKSLLEITGARRNFNPHTHYRVDYSQNRFYFTIARDNSWLYVGSEKFNRDVIKAASQIVEGYINPRPCFRYKEKDGCIAIEWHKFPDKRYEELLNENKENLVRLNEPHLKRIVSKLRGTLVSIW